MYPNEPYQTHAPNQSGVFLEMAVYQKVLEALEVLKSVGVYNAVQDEEINTQPTLTELFERVAVEKERMTLTYQNNVFLAVVPIEDVNVIEQLEDCVDNADADDALKEEGESLTSEQVDKILGW
jgi:hypothetical protein